MKKKIIIVLIIVIAAATGILFLANKGGDAGNVNRRITASKVFSEQDIKMRWISSWNISREALKAVL